MFIAGIYSSFFYLIYFPDSYNGHGGLELSACTKPILSIHQLDPEVSIIFLTWHWALLSVVLRVAWAMMALNFRECHNFSWFSFFAGCPIFKYYFMSKTVSCWTSWKHLRITIAADQAGQVGYPKINWKNGTWIHILKFKHRFFSKSLMTYDLNFQMENLDSKPSIPFKSFLPLFSLKHCKKR